MTPSSETRPEREIKVAVFFCKCCGRLAQDSETIETHLSSPENEACSAAWDGGNGRVDLNLRMIRLTAETGDQELRLTVTRASGLPEFKWDSVEML